MPSVLVLLIKRTPVVAAVKSLERTNRTSKHRDDETAYIQTNLRGYGQ